MDVTGLDVFTLLLSGLEKEYLYKDKGAGISMTQMIKQWGKLLVWVKDICILHIILSTLSLKLFTNKKSKEVKNNGVPRNKVNKKWVILFCRKLYNYIEKH